MGRNTDYITCVIKQAGEAPVVGLIKNMLRQFQNIVGGHIEVVYIGRGILMIVNEEGKLDGSRANFAMGDDFIFGNAVFVRENGEDFGSLEEDQIDFLKEFFINL